MGGFYKPPNEVQGARFQKMESMYKLLENFLWKTFGNLFSKISSVPPQPKLYFYCARYHKSPIKNQNGKLPMKTNKNLK